MEKFKLPNIPDALLLNVKVEKAYLKLKEIIVIVEQREISDKLQHEIQVCLAAIDIAGKEKSPLIKSIRREQHKIIKLLEKHLKLVPQNYYQVMGMSIGLAAIGVPFGVVFGILLDNMAFISVGLPIGLGIGMAIGAGMDKKAAKENRQLPFTI